MEGPPVKLRIISMIMGVWFLSSFFGNYFSGFLGTFWERRPVQPVGIDTDSVYDR